MSDECSPVLLFCRLLVLYFSFADCWLAVKHFVVVRSGGGNDDGGGACQRHASIVARLFPALRKG